MIICIALEKVLCNALIQLRYVDRQFLRERYGYPLLSIAVIAANHNEEWMPTL